MTNPDSDPRVAALARRVERLTAAVAVLAVGLLLVVAWAVAPRPELDAERFLLRDGAGRFRGALALDEEGRPTVRLNDPSGRAMLYGVVRDDGTPRLRLGDAGGTSRLVLELEPDGTPHARLLDAAGRTAAHAWLDAEGRPAIEARRGAAVREITPPDSAAARPAAR